MAKKIQLRRGDTATRLSKTPSNGEPYLDLTTRELYIGDGTTAGGVATGGGRYEALAAVAPSATVTIDFTKGRRRYVGKVTVTGGASSFTCKIVLPTTNRLAGDIVDLKVPMPASANPTIEIRDATAAGTLLVTIAPDAGTARTYAVRCFFTGTAWELFFSAQQL